MRFVVIVLLASTGFSQTNLDKPVAPVRLETPKQGETSTPPLEAKEKLGDKEREELLALIKALQDRVTKLESAQAGGRSPVSKDETASAAPKSDSPIYDGSAP